MGNGKLVRAAAVLASAIGLSVSQTWGAVTVSGYVSPVNPATWNSGTGVQVGYSSDGSLVIDSGTAVTTGNAFVGGLTGFTGTATVTGVGTQWKDGSLTVGWIGPGALDVRAGAALVTSQNTTIGLGTGGGVITVDGQGSSWNLSGAWLYVGNTGLGTTTGNGTLNVQNGGIVTGGPYGYLGYNSNTVGVVNVAGTGSALSVGTLDIGSSGKGMVSVTNGGQVAATMITLGTNVGGSGAITVDGAGSTLTDVNDLTLGISGTGTLNIMNGGIVNITGRTEIHGAGGSINFGANGGTLTTTHVEAAPSQLTGTGTINALGLISDIDLVFDATHGAVQTLKFQGPNQNVTLNLDVSQDRANPGYMGLGVQGSGTLTIRDGVTVHSGECYVGYNAGCSGTATVFGAGSTWDTASLYVGWSGSGSLTVGGGGTVRSIYGRILSGTASIDGAGSSWSVSSGFVINGNLSVTNGGQGVDGTGDPFFRESDSLGSSNTSVGTMRVDGAGSQWTGDDMSIGAAGIGTLSITNGGVVNLRWSGTIGNSAKSNGTATVDGAGSVWRLADQLVIGANGSGTLNISNGAEVTSNGTVYFSQSSGSGKLVFGAGGGTLAARIVYASPSNFQGTGMVNTRGIMGDFDVLFDATHGPAHSMQVTGSNVTINLDMSGASGTQGDLGAGYSGNGTLTIRDGIAVSSTNGILGDKSGSLGVAIVSGAGSAWNNQYTITVGYSLGTGKLMISGGGQVTGSSLTIGTGSLLAMDVGSTMSVGASGTLTNGGTIRLSAGAGLAAQSNYKPITANTISGVVQAVGGKWSGSSFTVSNVTAGTAGVALGFDRSKFQRVLTADPSQGQDVGASFLSVASVSNMTFTATDFTGPQLTLLQSTPGVGQVLDGWNFATTGYATGNPVYLSLGIGSGFSADALSIWHFDGSAWAPFAAGDLAYDGKYASFTVTSFSGYAVVNTPEPGTLGILGMSLLGLIARGTKGRERKATDGFQGWGSGRGWRMCTNR